MKKKILVEFAFILLMAGMAGVSAAALTTIGTGTYGGSEYRLIYDSGSNLTWLDYTKGDQLWLNQMTWAASLNAPGVISYNLNPGVSMKWSGDWRLPDTVDGPDNFSYDGTTSVGYNITSSELGHLFYDELGNLGRYDTSGNSRIFYGLDNTGDFDNLVETWYWSGTDYGGDPDDAWIFNFYAGNQDRFVKDWIAHYAISVRPGQLVPIPGTFGLLVFGLAGLISLKLHRQRT